MRFAGAAPVEGTEKVKSIFRLKFNESKIIVFLFFFCLI